MKLSEIKAAIKAKANTVNIVPVSHVQIEPPVQKIPPVASAASVIKVESVKSTKKKTINSSAPAQPLSQQLATQQMSNAPVQQPIPIALNPTAPAKSKASKTKAAINTPDLDEIVTKVLKFKVDYDKIVSKNPRNPDKFILLKGGAEHLAQIFGYRTTCEIIKNIEQFNVADFNKSFIMYEAKVIVYDKDGKPIAEGVGSCNSAESRFNYQAMADRINVCLKIAKKRAFVDGILTATGTSRFFIQDLDDLVINAQENEPVQ